MKRLIEILIIFMCVMSVPFTAFAANEVATQPETDVLYSDEQPQYSDKEPQQDVPIPNDGSEAFDAPADEDTYEEQPNYSDTPRLYDGEAGRGSIEDPDKYWATKGYPSDISFAYEAGGEVLEDGTIVTWWEIGIVNADDNRKQEIIDMLSPNTRITFVDCKYSYSEREAVYKEILASEDDHVHGAIMLLNSEEVMVRISEEHIKEYAEKFNQQYGSLVIVDNGLDGAKEDALTGGADGGADKSNRLWIWTIAVILFMGAVVILFHNQTHLIPAMQTTRGTVVTRSVYVSKKKTITAVKNSEIAPRDEVFNKILRSIDENN